MCLIEDLAVRCLQGKSRELDYRRCPCLDFAGRPVLVRLGVQVRFELTCVVCFELGATQGRCPTALCSWDATEQDGGQGTEQLSLLVVFSTHRAVSWRGEKSWLGRESVTNRFDRRSKLPGKILCSYYVTAAWLIATSLARSYLISKASC